MRLSPTTSIVLLAACLLLPACSKDDGEGPAAPQIPQTTFDQVMLEAGMVLPLAEAHDDVTVSEEVIGDFRYTYEYHDALENNEGVTCLGLNDDVIWPGSLVRGDQAYSYVYEPIIAPRAPITLSISLEGGGMSGLSERVSAPSLSTVRQGIANLVSRALEGSITAPAQVDFSYQQVYSASQMSLFVDADVSYGGGSLETSFNWDESSTTNKIMAKYTQVYYSVDMDTPADPRGVLAGDISEEALRAAFPAGSRPLYVAGVKYGMMAIMCIETSFSMSQMQLALDAAYNGVVDADLGFGYTATEVMNSSSIRIVVYGGATGGIEELTGFDGFMNIVSASTTFSATSPGVPLVYKFRHLRDNTLALISLTSQYTIVRPLRIRQGVRVTCTQFVCEMSADDEPFADSDVDMDRFKVICNAFNRVDANDPGTQINAVDQVVFYWSSPDWYEMWAGRIFNANGSIDLLFDTENYDWNYAQIKLGAYARDYDSLGSNEDAWGYLTLTGPGMIGTHNIYMYSSDFQFRAVVLVQLINY